LIKRWAVGIYDPLFLLLLANAFGWAIVWFMFLRGDIALGYLVSFTAAQLALYAGMWLGRPAAAPRRHRCLQGAKTAPWPSSR
jgi:hypothetical protein